MNKSLISGFIGGFLAALLFFLPGWAILLIIWAMFGYLTGKALSTVEKIHIGEKFMFIIGGFLSFIVVSFVYEERFLMTIWSLFTDKSLPKFRSPIYFEEDNLTKE